MPAIPLRPPDASASSAHPNPLPTLLKTPLGLALVEIQGSLNIPDQGDEAQRIGKLEFPGLSDDAVNDPGPWMKNVHFYVGERQRLVGEVKKLDKPVGVLKKRGTSQTSGNNEELEIIEVIYWKLYFGSRPEFV